MVRGSPHEAYARTFFANSAIVPFESAELTWDAVGTGGGVDVSFGDGIALTFWINGTLSRGCCELKGGPYFEPKYFGDGVGIVVLKRLDQAIADGDRIHAVIKGVGINNDGDSSGPMAPTLTSAATTRWCRAAAAPGSS